jgi:hypothetical protein
VESGKALNYLRAILVNIFDMLSQGSFFPTCGAGSNGECMQMPERTLSGTQIAALYILRRKYKIGM